MLIMVLLALVVWGVACSDDTSDNGDAGEAVQASDTPSQAQIRVNVDNATVFTRPSRVSDVMASLEEGTTFEVEGISRPDEFGAVYYPVNLGDTVGWIPASQVEFSGDATTLVTVDMPPAELVFMETIEAEAIRDATLAPEEVSARVTVPQSNAYAAPDTSSEVIRAVVEGEEFSIVARTPPDASGTVFYATWIDNRVVGWLLGQDLELEGDTQTLQLVASPTPSVGPPPDSTSTPSPATVVAVGPAASPTPTTPSQPDGPTPTVTLQGLGTPAVAMPTATALIVASATPSSAPPVTPTLFPTATVPTVRRAEPPLIEMDLPPGWDQDHFKLPFYGAGIQGDLLLSVYEGPLVAGTNGTIWIVWRFPALLTNAQTFSLWPNAILYLQNMLFSDCNIGIDTENRTFFSVGIHEALGARYSVADCESGFPDVGGWFASLRVDGENYIFYMAIEPPNRAVEAIPALQTVLDSVRFLPVPEE